jgi:hypothetical protein
MDDGYQEEGSPAGEQEQNHFNRRYQDYRGRILTWSVGRASQTLEFVSKPGCAVVVTGLAVHRFDLPTGTAVFCKEIHSIGAVAKW